MPQERGEKSGSRLLIVLSFEKDGTKVANECIDIFAEEAEIDKEGQRVAKAFAMLQRSIGTDIHHELFGEFGLSEPFTLAGFEKDSVM